MNQNMLLGILIPFAGTTLGAAMVFFMRKEMNDKLQKALLGFASGVMIAASVWSLLIPAIEMAEENGSQPWLPAAAGFLLGMGFLLLLDTVTPHMHPVSYTHLDVYKRQSQEILAAKKPHLMEPSIFT